MHRTRAIVAGLALAALVAAPVMAANDIPETVNVNSTVAVSGLPASINYGSLDVGQTSATQTVTATIAANVTWTLKVGGTDFAGPVGTVFPASARSCKFSVVSGPVGIGGSADTWHPFGTVNFCDGVSTPASGLSAGTGVLAIDLNVTPPATAKVGAHTGTVTFTFTANP